MASAASFKSCIENLEIEFQGGKTPPACLTQLIDLGNRCSTPANADIIQSLATQLLSRTDIPVESRNQLATLTKIHFLQLCDDNLATILDSLSAPELLKIARVCKYIKNLIETNPKLQARIAHFYLLKMSEAEKIPPHEMKVALNKKGNLVVEVANELSLWKLNNQFQKSIPWITVLIAKQCSNALPQLFTNLKGKNQLQFLYLTDCEWKQDYLKEIQSIYNNDRKPPTVSLSNTKTEIIDLQDLSSSMSFVLSKGECSMEQILWEPEDATDLGEFEKKAEDPKASAQDVMIAMDKLKPVISSRIVSFIWYSILYKPKENTTSVMNKMYDAAREFVAKNPHHPAVIAAAKNQKP